MKKQATISAGVFLASSIIIGGIASAAIISIPSFSGPNIAPSPSAASIFSESDLYDSLIRSINILDARTNGTQSFDAGNNSIINLTSPIQRTDAVNKEYVDSAIYYALTEKNNWTSVSLKTSENFDPKCRYSITTEKNAFLASHVQANELKYYEPWGAGEYQASWVSPLKKTVLNMDVGHFYDDVVKTSTEKVVKIEKNCSL